ncbi:PorP/SprF family type IX secretion system membrane protein [Ferruginibacter sp. SUN002]|uniref:PorP/SprF family type IX secretion system membrane protein n=1 Tax=Ferruginibacter sp. SUN002 TaxID=2937789 RepID=UPI003D368059
MKRTVPQFVCGILLLFILGKSQAQDIHFSQFFEAPLLRNPALAGLFNGDLRFQMVYRNQWNSVTDAYSTGNFNGEYKVPVGSGSDFMSVGAQVLFDKAGTAALSSTHILPVFNYHKSLSEEKNKYLSVGFMAGIVQKSIDRSKITTNSQFDGVGYNPNWSDGESFNNPTYSYFDGSVGMSFNSQIGSKQENNYFVGISYHHFNRSAKTSFYNNSDNKLIAKWVASAGLRTNATESSYMTFHLDYSKQGPYTETIGGAMYSVRFGEVAKPQFVIHGGVVVRWNDAIVPIAKLDKGPISISLSYDANVSKLKSASKGRGGMELGLAYQKFFEKNNTTEGAARCPRF